MNDSSIAGRTDQLRREIELIQQEERRYRNHSSHSLVENAEHEKRGFRVLAIREELKLCARKIIFVFCTRSTHPHAPNISEYLGVSNIEEDQMLTQVAGNLSTNCEPDRKLSDNASSTARRDVGAGA